jgi:hypothetical protein
MWCLMITFFKDPNPNRPKPLEMVDSTPISKAPYSLQLGSTHSSLRYPRTLVQRPVDVQLEKAHRLLRDLSSSCISCWLLGKSTIDDHRFDSCTSLPSSRDGWHSWRQHLLLPQGVCVRCGCPQKVCPCIYIYIYIYESLSYRLIILLKTDNGYISTVLMKNPPHIVNSKIYYCRCCG